MKVCSNYCPHNWDYYKLNFYYSVWLGTVSIKFVLYLNLCISSVHIWTYIIIIKIIYISIWLFQTWFIRIHDSVLRIIRNSTTFDFICINHWWVYIITVFVHVRWYYVIILLNWGDKEWRVTPEDSLLISLLVPALISLGNKANPD